MKKNFSPNSVAETHKILVEVWPNYISKDELAENFSFDMEEEKNIFTYEIKITNRNDQWAKLLYRHWIIIDSEGENEKVSGKGVVGKQPQLFSGESFSYSSFCPLSSKWGTMEGDFTMILADGSIIKIDIARFYLIADKSFYKKSIKEFNF